MNTENDNLTAALVALGAIGLGIGAFGALSSWEKRRRFSDALRTSLEREGVGMVDATLGRQGEVLVWVVTVNTPWSGVRVYHARFNAEDEPYAPQLLGALIHHLRAALASERKVA